LTPNSILSVKVLFVDGRCRDTRPDSGFPRKGRLAPFSLAERLQVGSVPAVDAVSCNASSTTPRYSETRW
jgi:hypothetical protein